MFSPVFFTLAIAVASVSANCIHGTSLHRREVTAEGKVEVSKFGYSGEQGPLNWAGLDPANSACRASKVQSPIVIDQSVQKAAEAPKMVIENVAEAEFENLGTTLEVIVKGTTTVGGKEFALQQFHMHTPSEHRILDEYFPLEIHMVHEAADKSIAVVAIPFQLTEDGSTTELLTAVTENLEAVKEPGSVTKTGALNFEQLIQAVQTEPLFEYTGSLTTPPCAEGLTFLVMEKPMALNVKTYNAIKSVIKYNARYTQNTLGQNNLLDVAVQLAAKDDGCNVAAVNGTEAVAAVEQGKEVAAEQPKEAAAEQPKEAAAEQPKEAVNAVENQHENVAAVEKPKEAAAEKPQEAAAAVHEQPAQVNAAEVHKFTVTQIIPLNNAAHVAAPTPASGSHMKMKRSFRRRLPHSH